MHSPRIFYRLQQLTQKEAGGLGPPVADRPRRRSDGPTRPLRRRRGSSTTVAGAEGGLPRTSSPTGAAPRCSPPAGAGPRPRRPPRRWRRNYGRGGGDGKLDLTPLRSSSPPPHPISNKNGSSSSGAAGHLRLRPRPPRRGSSSVLRRQPPPSEATAGWPSSALPRVSKLRATAAGGWPSSAPPRPLLRPRAPALLLPAPALAAASVLRRLPPPPPSHAHGFASEERGNPFLAHLSPRDGNCLLVCLICWTRASPCTVEMVVCEYSSASYCWGQSYRAVMVAVQWQ
ncbi:hypothetical protein PVAP13_1NG118100 [Panicum virgatum]|uniref:Uncharacterized protein n=1 Tax=Panicum virgatum TaxID=38727 RepID=A0A8T0WNI2_PANVG|nr:hypothetical protein PVAP13_1NG118100 [Panicum virgatum]